MPWAVPTPNYLFISPFLPPTHTIVATQLIASSTSWGVNMAGNLISISLGPGIFSLLWKCHISEHSPTRRAETGGNFGQLELPYTVIAPRAWDYTTFSFIVRKSFQENQTYLDKVRTCIVKYTLAVKRFRDYSVKLSERRCCFSRSKEKPRCLRVIYMLCLILILLCSSPQQHQEWIIITLKRQG